MGERRRTARTRRGLVVANPAAGSVSPKHVDEVASRCGAHLGEVTTAWTEGPDGGVALVAEHLAAAERAGAPIDVVVAVGGDGTAREAAEGIARSRGGWPGGETRASHVEPGLANGAGPALFIVPAGSGNSTYKALWSERSWDEAAAAALGADRAFVRRLDLLRLVEADRAALLGVNAGLVARIAQLLQEQTDVPDSDRYWAAIGTALQELQPYPGRVILDGGVLYEGPITLATVGGVKSFGRGNFQLLPHSELDDGILDVCVVGDLTQEGLEELARLVPTGEHLGRPGVTYGKGRRVTLERTDGEPLVLEHDGDPRPADDVVTVNVVPGAVPALAAVDSASG